MRVRRLDNNNDMTFGNGGLNYLQDCTEAVAQNVYTRLKLWLGEWFQDKNQGVDYLGKCLEKNSIDTAADEIRRHILQTDGVLDVRNYSVTTDPDKRAIGITGELVTVYGKTQLNYNGSYFIGESGNNG